MAATNSSNSLKIYNFEKEWKFLKSFLKNQSFSNHYFPIDGCPDIKYSIIISHITKKTGENVTDLKVGLKLKFPRNKTIKANYSIEIPSVKFKNNVSKFYKKSFTRHVVPCLNHQKVCDDIKGQYISLIVKGTLEVKPKDVPAVDIVAYNHKNDLKLIVGDRPINAHKYLISKNFSKLGALFETGNNEIIIKDYSFDVVNAAVAYVYDNPLPENLENEKLIQLIKFAEDYGIDNLKEKVELILGEKIDDSNCIEIAKTSNVLNTPNLKRKSIDFLVKEKKAKNPKIDFMSLDDSLKLEMFEML